MTLPSALLDKMAEVLAEHLPDNVNVEVIDRMFGARDRDFVTVPYPSVLLTKVRMSFGGNYSPPLATAEFAAVCLARFDEVNEDPDADLSGGDVAMNLAALVAANVEGQRWEGLAFSSARRVRVESLQSKDLYDKAINGWSVRWEQDFEVSFSGADVEQFKKLAITFEMGDVETADIEAVYVRPEEPTP